MVTAGVPFAVTVTARDASDVVVGDYAGQMFLQSSDPQTGELGAYTFTPADGGSHTFQVTLTNAAYQFVLAFAANFHGFGLLTVQPAAAAFLVLQVPDEAWSGVSAGTPLTVTVEAYDAYGNLATGYAGTVHFGSTDPSATLPPDYTFAAADAGSQSFTVVFGTPGPVTLTVDDGPGGLGVSIDLGVV